MWPFDRRKKKFLALRDRLFDFNARFTIDYHTLGTFNIRTANDFMLFPESNYVGYITAALKFVPAPCVSSEAYYFEDRMTAESTSSQRFGFLMPIKVYLDKDGSVKCDIKYDENDIFYTGPRKTIDLRELPEVIKKQVDMWRPINDMVMSIRSATTTISHDFKLKDGIDIRFFRSSASDMLNYISTNKPDKDTESYIRRMIYLGYLLDIVNGKIKSPTEYEDTHVPKYWTGEAIDCLHHPSLYASNKELFDAELETKIDDAKYRIARARADERLTLDNKERLYDFISDVVRENSKK